MKISLILPATVFIGIMACNRAARIHGRAEQIVCLSFQFLGSKGWHYLLSYLRTKSDDCSACQLVVFSPLTS
jgi:hypothetical protein